MNERADELAAQGAQGLRRRDNAIYVPPGRPHLQADTVPDKTPRRGGEGKRKRVSGRGSGCAEEETRRQTQIDRATVPA